MRAKKDAGERLIVAVLQQKELDVLSYLKSSGFPINTTIKECLKSVFRRAGLYTAKRSIKKFTKEIYGD